MRGETVVAEARAWVDTPYRRRGRSASGIDCLGLLIVVARALDVAYVDHVDYGDWPDPRHRILRELDTQLKVMPTAPFNGAIGVFNQRSYRLPCHAGFFAAEAGVVRVIHARIDVLRVVEEIYRPHDSLSELRLIRLYAFHDLEF